MVTPSISRRFLARFLDQIFLVVVWIPLAFKSFAELFAGGSWSGRIAWIAVDLKWLVFALVCQFLYRILFLKMYGATPGKLILGLRLISSAAQTKELTWLQTLIRVFADGLSFFFGLGLFSLALCRYDRCHVSDWLAETRVVRLSSESERLGLGAPSRHIFGGLLFFFIFSTSGFLSVAQLLKKSHFGDGQWQIPLTYFLSR